MEFLGINPGRRVALYFLIVILAGATLLSLPFASSGEKSIGFLNALFTATSAVCVTGLVVLDTGKDFSAAGQIIILLLIQLGGLGIMTFTTALLLSIGSHLSLGERFGFSQSFSSRIQHSPGSLLKAIFISTIIIEMSGAAILFFFFLGDFPAGEAAYHAVFHAISAFCNAGFSTFSNSLENYSGNVGIIFIFSALIVFGGLGFVVFHELFNRLRNRSMALSLHSRICLITTFFLLILGTLFLYLAEYSNSLQGRGMITGLANAFFQAVTARTAGFNTIPQMHLTELSVLLTMILMFIGACPGSTGGGIKTTTFAVILLLLYHRFMGRRTVALYQKSIAPDSITRALTVLLLATLLIVFSFSLFLAAQALPVAHSLSRGTFVENLFEVISAFGTVGLSMGVTPGLYPLGKIILILLMFAGRVGLLTLAFALSRPERQVEIVYLEEEVMIG